MSLIANALRDRGAAEAPAVTTIELFFDLVYVFAVTQLSHHLVEHLSARGALETLVLFLAVWWAWNYTAWATNWIDPDRSPVRLLLIVLMLISLIMSAAIPQAFAGRALAFAAAYVAIQVTRSAFVVAAFGRTRMGRNYAQLLAWSAIAGVAWVAGAALSGDARVAAWIVALALDYGAPMHGFALPGAGATDLRDWTLRGGHLAERNQLVVLIALGESILADGASFSGLAWSARAVAAFTLGFTATVSLWWMYFVGTAEAGARAIAASADPARIGRAAYAYGHGIMVGGVIVVAVGVELTIAHPSGHGSWGVALAVLGGPALYLAGNALFSVSLAPAVPWSRVAGIALLTALIPVGVAVSPLAAGATATAVMVGLALVTGARRPAQAPAGG
jgi:low temperature requirement protein LtrA